MQQVNVGIIGGGTVGGGVWLGLERNGPLFTSRLGVEVRVTRVAVRDLSRKRAVKIPARALTTDWRAVVNDPDVHVICELMGGVTTAREVVLAALKAGKPVVTANKALLSAHGMELFAAARANGVGLYFEASVAGGIPIIKALREGLVGNRILSLHGIVNGTCNYILSRMKCEGAAFDTVLADAQRLGYAEAEPSLDVDGHDAAHKTGILASLAHGCWINPAQIHTEGIRGVTPLDIQFAGQLGFTIKLLGIVKRVDAAKAGSAPGVNVAVYPALVPNHHVLASVNGVFNAVAVRGDIVGETLFYGRGAGQDATASAVLSDIADAARDLKCGTPDRVAPFTACVPAPKVVKMDDVTSRYYLRLSVADKPGTLARIASILGQARIGISSVIQPEGHAGESVPLILMIHDATNAAMRKALARISRLAVIKGPPVMFRVETFD